MIAAIANRCKDNQATYQHASAITSAHPQRYKALSVRYWMPRYTHLHAHETLEAIKGNRSLAPKCPVTFAKVKAILGYDDENLAAVEISLPHLCTTVLRERLNLLLAIQGRPPLLIPRPETEFAISWILYQAVYFDPNNLTLWSSREVNLEGFPLGTGPGVLWELKAQAQEAIIELGYDDSEPMRTRVNKIWHYYLDGLKYQKYYSRGKLQRWATMTTRSSVEVEKNVTALCSLAFENYSLRCKTPCDKRNFKANFERAAFVAFALDPFTTEMTLERFKEYKMGEKFPVYQRFLALKKALDSLVEHSVYAQTPMKKIGNDALEKYKVPNFDTYFALFDVYIPKSREEAKAEADKTASLDMTMVSLGKRLKQMKIDPDSEDELPCYNPPTKKKAVAKRKKRGGSSTRQTVCDSDLDSMAETEMTPRKRQVDTELLDFGRKGSTCILDTLDTSSISSRGREQMMIEEKPN